MSVPSVFAQLCVQSGLPAPVAEFRFHKVRKWRFDFAFVDARVALECEGAIFTGGRHTRGSGFLGDMEKYNTAASLGWLVIRCEPKNLKRSDTLTFIRAAIHSRE